jgi:8-oxo-dGTP pyrophosphatase MutT (NUDIX family)
VGGDDAIPTYAFVLCVVRHGRRFLLVQERKHGQRWYVPAGRVELGESFAETARRETLEESGVNIVVDGVIRIEYTPQPTGARLRVIYTARPADDGAPRAEPNEHSLQAGWFTREEAAALPLRGPEVMALLHHVADGGAVYPLSMLTFEGAPLRRP